MHTTTTFRAAGAQGPRRERGPANLVAFFSQECTACGRQLRVRLEALGRQVGCRHCGCQLTASDDSTRPTPNAAIERAGELLAQQDRSSQRTPSSGLKGQPRTSRRQDIAFH